MTSPEIFGGDTGNSSIKDSIKECQRKPMGAVSGQIITGDTSPLGQHRLRGERKDRSLRIPDDNTGIKQRLQVSTYVDEAGHCWVKSRVQRCFLSLCVLKGMRGGLAEVVK